MSQNQLVERVQDVLFLYQINFKSVERLKDGRNSRTWKIITNEKNFVLKEYGSKNKNSSDRLNREFSFLEFLHCHGIRNVPIAIHKNVKENIAIYSFIEGGPVKEIDNSHVIQCSDFIFKINSLNKEKEAKNLLNAAEAFFSIKGHIDCVENRLKQLLI